MTFRKGIERKRAVWASGLIATAVVLAGAATLLFLIKRPAAGSIASLVKASSADARSLEPRLSGGFAWAPFRPARRNLTKTDPIFASALGATLGKFRDVRAPDARHEEGVAELLAGHSGKALSNLTIAAAEQSNDPAVWNDLAVVFHETARQQNAPELLADALVACDRALSQRPRFPEALFNRALVIERLGLKDDAREAWDQYLATDSTSDWATEARTHLHALAPEVPFLARLDREYDHVRRDPAAATALVRSDPSSARGIGALETLGRWGKAVLRHDDNDAERHLDVARQLGEGVALIQGDLMLKQAVAAIDAAGGATRAILAQAHADYRDGIMTFDEHHRPVAAEPTLRRAVSGFEKAGSPEVLPARYFAANTLFEQGNGPEAEREIEALSATASPNFPACRAGMLRSLGSFSASRGDWGAAITYSKQSESLYDHLGDLQNASAVRRLLAFVYDRIGDPGTAWKYRIAALRGMGGKSSAELEQAVASITDGAMLRHDWPKALVFLNLEIQIARRIHDDLQLAAKPLVRAVVRDRLNDEAGSLSDIAAAKDALARITDSSDREYLSVALLRASAMLSTTPPAQADALLTEAIKYQATRSDPLKLPGLFLERARARRKMGNVSGAMADIQHGIAELEQHRQSLPPGEARWGAFHSAEELFDEGVDLAIAAADAEAAFRFAERSRARALLDSYQRTPVLDYKQVPAGMVIVEYVALPKQLVIFTADASGVRAVTVECGREKLTAETDAFAESVRKAQSLAGNQSAALYRRLIEPVATQLLGARTVVFVPDGATSIVPFSALTDGHGVYLIQQHVIVVALSAAAFAAAAERRGESAVARSALVISASEPGGGGAALEYADAEARQVANAYRKATRLTDNDAELDELIKRAPEVDVIHFAGHAIGDERGIAPASILLRQNGQQRRVGVAEIAKLRLRRRTVVVMAGCSTGRGERRASEGVISVAHGFLTAGAPSVIATLWPIDDEAASIFYPRLHALLVKGLSPAEALREAQLESIRRGDVPASLWAAVQDIGS